MITGARHFLLPVHTSGEHCMAPNYFLLSLTREDVVRLLHLQNVALELKGQLDGQMEYTARFRDFSVWDFRPAFFGGRPDGISEQEEEKLEELYRLVDEMGPVELSTEDFNFIDDIMAKEDGDKHERYQRLDYCILHVRVGEFNWTACPKHCDYEVDTSILSLDKIRPIEEKGTEGPKQDGKE